MATVKLPHNLGRKRKRKATRVTNDADVLAMEHVITELWQRLDGVIDQVSRAEEAMFEWERQNPEPKTDAEHAAWERRKDAAEWQAPYGAAWTQSIRSSTKPRTRLIDMPASTLEGLQAKARAAQTTEDVDLAWSVVRDLTGEAIPEYLLSAGEK